MGSMLYVGNLPEATTGQDLQQLFATQGTVESARIVADPATGKSFGYGFVLMGSQADADTALAGLNGREQQGQTIVVEVARGPKMRVGRKRRSGGSGGGGGDRGGGGSFGGRGGYGRRA